MHDDSGSRSFDGNGADRAAWPQSPSELVYDLDAVVALYGRIQQGERIDVLEGLLDCVNWREIFGSTSGGFLRRAEVDELRRYYRTTFSTLDRFFLAEQLSTQLTSALLASGDLVMSDAFRQLGRERPELWNEVRAFFRRKEVATVMAMLADTPREE
jgi:hypothetical protein